ncbi:MAG: putative transrane protein [Myxococcaceae bacterium]|nr:putative transrane protein [Myxococcaceae bacterium]
MNALHSPVFRNASGRLVLALTVALAAALIMSTWFEWHTSLIAAWDAGSLTLLIVSWLLIARESPAQTQKRAAVEDPGRPVLRLITISSCVASLFAVLVAMRKADSLWPSHQAVVVGSLIAAVSSWLLMHTSYALHYAHLFYRDDGDEKALLFPACDAPSGMDFAYFSFTLGMCYQVSDVSIQSTRVRRAALGHALLSFVFNTAVLALTLNLVLGSLG